MKKLPLLALISAVAAAASMHVIIRADGQLVPGRNINLNPGVADQFIGDIYRQRQVESKIVCTIPQHCAAISNDYRTVERNADLISGFGESSSPAGALRTLAEFLGLARHREKTRAAAVPDAWLGLYRTSNLENWLNGLVPGFPQDVSPLSAGQPWWQTGLSAASDGDLATDGTYIYGVGMFFNRGGWSMIGRFRLTDFNDESAIPIRWSSGFEGVIDRRNVNANIQLLDLPSIATDPTPRGDSTPGCGHVYVGYTAFTGTAGDSTINVVRSFNCGQTYVGVNNTPTPIKISGNFRKNQRVTFAVNPRPGTPLTTGGGTVYAVWRTFSPDMIVGTASLDFGKTWLPPVPYSVFNGVNTICAYDQPTVGSSNDLGLPGNDTARAVAFPSITIDSAGKLYLAWAERVDASGNPTPGNACRTTLQSKIVISTSTTGGLTWTARKAIDMGARCETTAADGRPGGLDQSVPNGAVAACPAGSTVGRASGTQIQPVVSHNAGKVMLIYKEGRGALNANQGPSKGFHAGRDRQMDVRAAQINPANNTLMNTTQVSVYTYNSATNDIKARDGAVNPSNAKAVHLPYLLQYSGGTNPFTGDHDGLAAAEPVVWSSSALAAGQPLVLESPAHAPTAADVPGTRFLGVWGGDNREAFFPSGDINGDWTTYFDAVNFPNSCNAGIRNSNDYLSSIGSATEAYVHQSFKPTDVLQQRTWVVTVRNRSNVTRTYRFALDEPGGDGSFDQRFDQQTDAVDVDRIGNTAGNAFCFGASYPDCTAYRTILPYSSMTFTVFGHISNTALGGPIRVNVFEATLNGPVRFDQAVGVTNHTLAAIVRLNPNPNNPASKLADQTADNSEHHGPAVTGPSVNTFPNPGPGNPGPGNTTQAFPGPGNPGPGNPGPGNPGPGNPGPGNAGFSDYTDYTYEVTAPGANTISQFASFADIAAAAAVDTSHFVQMFITRSHTVPTLEKNGENCVPVERTEDELVSLINARTVGELGVPGPGNPGPGNPGPGNPGPGNPGPGNTTAINPGPGNPGPGNNTFAVAPTNVALAAGGAAAFRATALATASAMGVSDQASDVGPDGTLTSLPKIDKAFVTVRFHHCEKPGGCTYNGKTYAQDTGETVPRTTGAAANNLIVVTVAPAPGDNTAGVITPPTPVGAGPDLMVSAPATLTTSPSAGIAGSHTLVGSFTIKNAGTTAAGPFTYRNYLVPIAGGEAVPLTGSLMIVGGLAPNATVTLAARDVTIPSGTTAGSYVIRIVVDDTNHVIEFNEANNLKDASFTVTTPIVLAACVPSSSLSVLIQNNSVYSYVPRGSWSPTGSTGIRRVSVETATASPIGIATGTDIINSCASNSVTGQTVCTANNNNVYVLNGSETNGSAPQPLQSGGLGLTSFSGGTCTNCGVALNALTNEAVISLNTSDVGEAPGFQFLNLNGAAPTFGPVMPSPLGKISENILIDPIRNLILSPAETGTYELVDVSSATPRFYENALTGFPILDSAAMDCTTGIALSTQEFTGNLYIADLTQATFSPAPAGSPSGTWTAPQQVQHFPEFDDGPGGLSEGTSGIAVAPDTHIGLVSGEFGGNTFGVIRLPDTSGTGIPAISDWVKCSLPNLPGEVVWNTGLDPHTMTAYKSPNGSGDATGLIANLDATYVARINLTRLLADVPRVGHTCDLTGGNLVQLGVVTFISTAPPVVIP
jgi:hypothetical protein